MLFRKVGSDLPGDKTHTHTIPEDMNQDRQDVALSDYPTKVTSLNS